MSSSNSFTKDNKTYKLSFFNIVTVSDEENGEKVKIDLNAPVWPPSKFLYLLIGFAGLGLFVYNLDLFEALHKKRA
jgi:hypothetical protein